MMMKEEQERIAARLKEEFGPQGEMRLLALALAGKIPFDFNPSDISMSLVEEALRRIEARIERPAITTRNVIYHVAPLTTNNGWRHNVRSLVQRSEVFNGHRVIAIATGEGMHSPDVVREAFGVGPWQFIEVPGNRELREVASFLPLLESVENTNANEATFYAHTKGNSTADGMLGAIYWRNAMYHNLLDRWEECMAALEGYAFVGTHKIVWRAGTTSPFPTQLDVGNWMLAGTFFWFRHDVAFTHPHWRDVPKDRYGAEAWPSIICSHFRHAKSMYQLWPEMLYPTPNPYDPSIYTDSIITAEELQDIGL